MTFFLAHEIAAVKQVAPATVNLHILPWNNPMVLQDQNSCNTCSRIRPAIWATCNKENVIIKSSTQLTVLDYEGIVADFYQQQNKPKHCDYVMEGLTKGNNKKIAFCELTCKKKNSVTGPYPTGKREYAWVQMGDTVSRWQAKNSYAAMIQKYAEKVFIFAWRDPHVPVINGNAGSNAMNNFNRSTTSGNVGVVSFGKRGDFELLQVKYPIQYEWQ